LERRAVFTIMARAALVAGGKWCPACRVLRMGLGGAVTVFAADVDQERAAFGRGKAARQAEARDMALLAIGIGPIAALGQGVPGLGMLGFLPGRMVVRVTLPAGLTAGQ